MLPTEPVSPLRLVVFLSGGGTTLANLLFEISAGRLDCRIERVVSSSPTARGLAIADQAGIPRFVVPRVKQQSLEEFSRQNFELCREVSPHLVALGGYLKRLAIPADFLHRVVNIHPSLIPAFCGHGFYGHHVHQAVLNYGAKLTGCTVHLVDDQYDHGPIIAQRAVPVQAGDTAESLAARVFAAECQLYPEVLRQIAAGRLRVVGRQVIDRDALPAAVP